MASALEERFRDFKELGGLVGTALSAVFLFAIAITNILILIGVCRSFQRAKNGSRFVEEDLDFLLANRRFLGRLFRPIFKLVRASWHMYPLGVLFGLGFDTATEIGVLGMSAESAARGLPIWSTLTFQLYSPQV
jgi:high-affinity nickel-transport protein